jgi:DNA-binding CsgD family transcriptional regulator/tetratricopeptide (TPR) repeat protein
MIPLDHVELLTLAAGAHRFADDRGRAEVLLQRALGELEPAVDSLRYSCLLDDLSRIQFTLNRGLEAVETAERALALLPEGEVSPERASLEVWLARIRVLRGRYREALVDGRPALATARAAGDRSSESEILNTLGMAQIALGQIEEGVSCLRAAIEIATEDDDIGRMEGGYSNLADALSLAGRTLEALDVAREGLAVFAARGARATNWLLLTASDLAFQAGDWRSAQEHFDQVDTHPAGRTLIFRLLRDTELALGAGDEERSAQRLEELEPLISRSSEPQWIGEFGTLKAECLRRRRDLPGARSAVGAALDRIELCTDDVMRIARVTAAGMRVEADIAQRARDLRERADERDALARARIHVQRLRAASQEGGPVESAWLAVGAAELARARGRSDAKLWRAAAREWEAMSRPFQQAFALSRGAEAQIDAGDRSAASETAQAVLEIAGRLGSGWLADEMTALAQRARLDLGESVGDGVESASGVNGVGSGSGGSGSGGSGASRDPFGLTARERQVLALLAEGATNRQIGAALFMAEKTASVHVSRILSKLGVRSRTQAAAVAHRLHLG